MQTVVVKESKRAKTRSTPDSTHNFRTSRPNKTPRTKNFPEFETPESAFFFDCSAAQFSQDYYFVSPQFNTRSCQRDSMLHTSLALIVFRRKSKTGPLCRCYNWDQVRASGGPLLQWNYLHWRQSPPQVCLLLRPLDFFKGCEIPTSLAFRNYCLFFLSILEDSVFAQCCDSDFVSSIFPSLHHKGY